MKKTKKMTTAQLRNRKIAELESMHANAVGRCRTLEQTIETLQNRLRTLEGERNALRQMARFARLSTMDVTMLNSKMATIAALLEQSTKLIAELKEPKDQIT